MFFSSFSIPKEKGLRLANEGGSEVLLSDVFILLLVFLFAYVVMYLTCTCYSAYDNIYLTFILSDK